MASEKPVKVWEMASMLNSALTSVMFTKEIFELGGLNLLNCLLNHPSDVCRLNTVFHKNKTR